MNLFVIFSAVIALLTTIGHFAVGSKQFLQPMLQASFEPVAQKVMHCVFHYISVFLILSTGGLFLAGSGAMPIEASRILVAFIALNYLAFAVWQIALALTSEIKGGVFKLFQWVFFVLIVGFAVTGLLNV